MTRLRQSGAFLLFLAKTYYADRCLRNAAALCFTTLLSLAPLTVVTFSILTAFPMFESFTADIQNFILENFVPASGAALQAQLSHLTLKASKMTTLGIASLIISALLLMDTIEGAFNEIWYVTAKRKVIPKFMVYWAVLTLGPILIGASLAGTSYLGSLPLLSDAALITHFKNRLLELLPFIATALACTLLYSVVPNTRVPLRNAIIGAIVAAILFELAKKGFALYVTKFSTYEMIYGALAALPVFLLWLFISWMVVLLGAEISYCLTHFAQIQAQEGKKPTMGQCLLHDFRTLGLIWQSQCRGQLHSSEQLRQNDTLLDEASLDDALTRLEAAELVHQTPNNEWALSKDMSSLTLADLYRAQHQALPEIEPEWLEQDPWYQALNEVVVNANNLTRTAQEIPLQPLYQT
jgi:membrane protein